MFLVTTADQRFWKTDEKILFLGKWCKKYQDKSIWENLDAEVLPYHWDDRQRLYRDYGYAKSIYEKHLLLISEKLNRLHGVQQSVRYWRIVVGQWLHYFIEILYDRYLSIKMAAQSGLVTNTLIVLPDKELCVPLDFTSFDHGFSNDPYNLYLYSLIIQSLQEIPFELKIHSLKMPWNIPQRRMSWKEIVKKMAGRFFSLVPSAFNRHVFISSYLGFDDLIRLQCSLKQLPYLRGPEIQVADVPVNPVLRETLNEEKNGSEFEKILCELIPWQIPKVYVESFRDIESKALKQFPKKPKLIFTANAHAFNEAFKIWAAHQVDGGTKLVISQHGGHYGTGLWNSEEDHEINICDRYHSWGWTSSNSKVVSMPSGKLLCASRKLKPNPRGKILWVLMSVPRYAYFMYSIPVGPQMESYFEDQFCFAEALSSRMKDQMRIRLHPCDFDWEQKKRWRESYPALVVDDGAQNFYQQLNESRLLVATYNATTYLETFVANFPTVLFWNPEHWEFRPEAQPYFERLKEAGILHDDPEETAKWVEKIAGDPSAWWHTETVQTARRIFVERFAMARDDFLEKIRHEVQREF